MATSASPSGRSDVTHLFVVRHGRVARDWRERIYGSMDVPLSAEGRSDAIEAARRLKGVELEAVVCSGLARTVFGADLLCAGRDGMVRCDDPKLRELERGDWAGLTFERLKADQPEAWEAWCREPDRLSPPGGESLDQLAARVLPRVEALAGEFAGSSVAIVAHSWVSRVLVCRALGVSRRHAATFDVPPGGIVRIDWPLRTGRAPVLSGFVLDTPPEPRLAWSRGPHRA